MLLSPETQEKILAETRKYPQRRTALLPALKIAKQALERLPGGPVKTANRKVMPPPREELGTSMEALIHHFKLYTEGIRPPAGEAYVPVESPGVSLASTS